MHRLKTKKNPTGSSVNDLLNEAIERGDFENLPGKGKRLNLNDYFSDDPNHQVANQLLIDNKAIPQPLQICKEIDQLKIQAEDIFKKEEARLQSLREEIATMAFPIISLCPDRETLIQVLDLKTWPDYFSAAPQDDTLRSRKIARDVALLQERIIQYNHKTERVIKEYMDLLTKANERIKKYNLSLMEGPVVGGSKMHKRIIDLTTHQTRIDQLCVPLVLLPEDTSERLQSYIDRTSPSFWKRLFRKV